MKYPTISLNGRLVPVCTLLEAKWRWEAFRDANALGASDMRDGCGDVCDGHGVKVARIAYNGVIFTPSGTRLARGASILFAEMLYLTDNGRIICGRHAGASASATAHDISGQPIEPLTAAIAESFTAEAGEPPACEECGHHVA
jgi:hypothetical protein